MNNSTKDGYFAYVHSQFEVFDTQFKKGQKYYHSRWGKEVTVQSTWWADGTTYVVYSVNLGGSRFTRGSVLQNDNIDNFIQCTKREIYDPAYDVDLRCTD